MPKMGWKSPYTGEVYEQGDPALKGRGFPPSCPKFSSENRGAGVLRMERVVLEDEDSGNDDNNPNGGEN